MVMRRQVKLKKKINKAAPNSKIMSDQQQHALRKKKGLVSSFPKDLRLHFMHLNKILGNLSTFSSMQEEGCG